MEKACRQALLCQAYRARTMHLYVLEAMVTELWLQLLLLTIKDIGISLELFILHRRVVTSYISHLQTPVIAFHFAMLKRYFRTCRAFYTQLTETRNILWKGIHKKGIAPRLHTGGFQGFANTDSGHFLSSHQWRRCCYYHRILPPTVIVRRLFPTFLFET